jgi:hypothetical protein
MATIGDTALTLADWAKRVDPEGKIDRIAELLSQTNQVLDDCLWIEGNLPTGHRTTVRTDLPSVTWRKLNYGVKPSKSSTKQVDDTCGMLEAYADVDKKIADLNGNTAAFRLSEDKAFIQAMNQAFARTFVSGDTAVHPERFLGLAARYPHLDTPNVLDAGGSGSDNTSVYLVVWGDQTVFGTFPKGSKAGLQHSDLGEVTLEDGEGGKYQGYRSHYKWEPGLVVKDWRYAVRIANIDVSDLATFGAGTDTSADLVRLLIQAYNLIPDIRMGRPAIYVNQTVKTWLDIQASEKNNVYLTIEKYAGRPVTEFWGIPVRKVDAIADTEAALTPAP